MAPVEGATGSDADCSFSTQKHSVKRIDVRLNDQSQTFFELPEELRSTIFSASEKTHIDVLDVESKYFVVCSILVLHTTRLN